MACLELPRPQSDATQLKPKNSLYTILVQNMLKDELNEACKLERTNPSFHLATLCLECTVSIPRLNSLNNSIFH